MKIQSLRELCREAEIVGSSIRGGRPGSVDACRLENEMTGETKLVYESDIEGGDFMFGDPDGQETLVTDVERVQQLGETQTAFYLPGDGSYHWTMSY